MVSSWHAEWLTIFSCLGYDPISFNITSPHPTTPPQMKSARELQDNDDNPKWSRRLKLAVENPLPFLKSRLSRWPNVVNPNDKPRFGGPHSVSYGNFIAPTSPTGSTWERTWRQGSFHPGQQSNAQRCVTSCGRGRWPVQKNTMVPDNISQYAVLSTKSSLKTVARTTPLLRGASYWRDQAGGFFPKVSQKICPTTLATSSHRQGLVKNGW